MKESYTLKDVIVEEGNITDLDLPFDLRDIEKKELEQFVSSDIQEGLRQSVELSLAEGNHYYRGICRNTGDLLFIWGLCKTEGTDIGVPWMLSSDKFQPDLDFIRKSYEIVSKDMFIGGIKVLCNYIHQENTKSIKWLKWLGFSFTPHPYLDTYLQFYKYKE